ncbi:MAG: SAM-dependent methyltransferase [Bacteroidaceae bacterium]|nr:SAM-dependent methyltransferase [Bacteroidaceae bacterium]
MIDEKTLQFAREHRQDDVHKLLLLASRYPDVDMSEVATQIESWRTAQTKIPSWAANDSIVWPSRLAMEQCSSEQTALYKASLAEGDSLTDLTGGLGVDCAFMSQRFERVLYVEKNEQLFPISSANFRHLGLSHIQTLCADGTDVLPSLPKQDWIYLDPARRSHTGQKVIRLSDCEPDVTLLETQLLEHARNVMVKCSPMLDIHQACEQLRSIQSIHVVALRGECKELLFILEKEPKKADEIEVFCTNLPDGETFSFTRKEERESLCEYTPDVEAYLYEPNAAVLKAGCFKLLAQRYNLKKLHPNTQLYTSSNLVPSFPGRAFQVEKVEGFGKNARKSLLEGICQANVSTRNFPMNSDSLRKRLRLTDGGDNYLFATTLSDGRHALILCKKA